MERKTIYIANDGMRFDGEKACEKYESILFQLDGVMFALRYDNNILFKGNAIRHTTSEVQRTLAKFMDLCSKAIPDYKETFQEVGEGKRDISFARRILSDYSNDFPCLWKAMHRFLCIDKYGIEYNQPYYVEHRLEFKGKIYDDKYFRKWK